MRFKPLSSLLVCLFFISCNSFLSLTNNVNKKSKFDTKEIYIESLYIKKQFSKDKIIVLEDDKFNILLNEVITKHLSSYYVIINDKYFVSADQLTVKGCSGQIIKLYNMFINDSKEIVQNEISDLKLASKLNLDYSKNTIIFLYSYKLGGLSDSKISAVIKDLEKENNFDYRIISLDNYDIIEK